MIRKIILLVVPTLVQCKRKAMGGTWVKYAPRGLPRMWLQFKQGTPLPEDNSQWSVGKVEYHGEILESSEY